MLIHFEIFILQSSIECPKEIIKIYELYIKILSRLLEAVANSTFGNNVLWTIGVIFDFFA